MKQHQLGFNNDIGLVPPDQIPYIWDQIEEHLERMAPHSEGELEPDDFFEALTEGDMQLWRAIENKDIVALRRIPPDKTASAIQQMIS